VPPAARSVMVISQLFLLVVAINLIGLLLGKFLSKAPEVAVRRALGASRKAIFAQQITECLLIGLCGGLLGILAAGGFLAGISRFLEQSTDYQLDIPMVAAGFGLALLAGTIAGIYPAWRVCAEPPANHLKTN
jgi:putative ABC transport system permease protein